MAQALALAGDGRSSPTLGDMDAWSSLAETVALFNAAALVTGDGAVGLHVGRAAPCHSRRDRFVDRLRALGSPEVAFKHVAPLVDHFDATWRRWPSRRPGTTRSIQVDPRSGQHGTPTCAR